MAHTTEVALTVQLPPLTAAVVTGWFKFSESVELLTDIARSELTSA